MNNCQSKVLQAVLRQSCIAPSPRFPVGHFRRRSVSTMAGRQLLSVAPMMDWTDVHYRQMARLISKHTWLWTEMVVDKTVLHTPNLDKHMWFPAEQRPIVCQLGGSDPATLAAATKKVIAYGYDEINLNCGCPSDRVAGAGCFGAALMLEAELVARCMAAMGEAAQGVPVNVKCRLGVDQIDSYEHLCDFIRIVSEKSPVQHFIIHSRKCFLKGLNPHQNRTVPPLRYEWVYGLKRDFPHLQFSLNGGVQHCHEARAYIEYDGPFEEQVEEEVVDAIADDTAATAAVQTNGADTADIASTNPSQAAADSTSQAQAQSDSEAQADTQDGCGCSSSASSSHNPWQPVFGGLIEGVMIGRAAYNDPWGCLGDADRSLFGASENAAKSRRQVLEDYTVYADAMVGRWATKEDGHRDPGVRTLMRPLLNLFHGEPGSKRWKNAVDGILKGNPRSVGQVLEESLHLLPDAVLDAPPRPINSLPQVSLNVLPELHHRAGHNQSPDGIDVKRPKRHTNGAASQDGCEAVAGCGTGTVARASGQDSIVSHPIEIVSEWAEEGCEPAACVALQNSSAPAVLAS